MADDTYSRGYRNDPPGRGSAAGPGVDPLTELARLIGQSDPFAAPEPRRPSPRPAEPPRQPADWQAEPSHHDQGRAHDHAPDHRHDPAYDDHAEEAQYGADQRDFPPQYDRQDHQAPADQGYYDDPHDTYPEQPYDPYRAEAPQDDGYAADPHGEHPDDLTRYYDEEEEAPAPHRRGWIYTAAAFIGLTIIGAAAAFTYNKYREIVPSIITRDSSPNKIIASSQNGDSRTNKRVDRIASGAPDERMVSREEQPVALPDTSRSAPSIGQGGPPMMAPSPPPADTGATGAPDGGPAPRKIQTVRVPPDSPTPVAVAPRQAPARATAAQAPSQSAPMPMAQQAPPPSPPQQGGPLSLSPQPQVATAAPPPPRAAARAPAPAAAAEAAGGYYVQVTAQRSEEEAQSSFRGIQTKYENLLGTHEPVIRRKDLGAKGIFFGAQVGPFSRESAVQLCENLKSAGASCMLQKN